MKISDDQSLFSWGLTRAPRTMDEYLDDYTRGKDSQLHGVFANSPSDFTWSDRIKVLPVQKTHLPPIVFSGGVRIKLQVLGSQRVGVTIAVIYCTAMENYDSYLGFPLISWDQTSDWTARVGELLLVPVRKVAVRRETSFPCRDPSVCLIKKPSLLYGQSDPKDTIKIARMADRFGAYVLSDVECSLKARFSADSMTVTLPGDRDELHCALFFTPTWYNSHLSELFNSIHIASGVNRYGMRGTDLAPVREGQINMVHKNHSIQLSCLGFALLVGGKSSNP
jgi:hypothetical protein